MEGKLYFSLPDKNQKNSPTQKISIVLLLILLVLIVVNLIKPSYEKPLTKNSALTLSEDKVKDLASKLASRNLYTRAARVWQDYLSTTEMPDDQRSKILFQIGTLFEKAGQYAEAIEYYYRSEITTKLSELEPQINTHIKNCYEKLGKFSALRYELMDRTSFGKTEPAGEKVVAEIGAEKITEADLDALIESTIDTQLTPIASFMTTQQLNEQKKKILEQYQNPVAKQEFLQSWITQEVLYRQALEEDLSEQPETKNIIDDLVRSVLSQQLMNKELADKINITESDLQTYYEANKNRYIESADVNDPNSTERQKSFDEVREQVINELLAQKRHDVQEELIKQMMDKYNVIIHSAAWIPADANEK